LIIDKLLREKLREQRNVTVNRDGVLLPGSIIVLEEKLNSIDDPYDADEVLAEIGSEYSRANLYPQQLEIVRTRVSRLPDDVILRIELARCLSYDSASQEHIQGAVATISEAIEMAVAQNVWVRYALTEQALIAVRKSDRQLFEDALHRLIEDVESGRKFEVDSRLFPSTIDNIPSDFCSQELIERYRTVISREES